MKALFAFIAFAIALVVITPDVQAQQKSILPNANKIVYATNTVEIQDTTQNLGVTVNKGTLKVNNKGFGNGSVTIIDQRTKEVIYQGKIRRVRIVGVANTANNATDSLKILSLKSTPFK